MVIALKIVQVGSSAGVILPKEALHLLRSGKGDTLYLTEAPHGALLLANDPEVEEQLRVFNSVMDDDAQILRVLAGL